MREPSLVWRETWRLLRLLAVAAAWGQPFVLLAFVNTSPGVPEHPALARLLETLQWSLLFTTMPILVVAGVMLVAWLSKEAPPLGIASLQAVLLMALMVGGMFLFMYFVMASRVSFVLFMLFTWLVLFGLIALPILGSVVTAATFWRRRRWLAVSWLIVWITVVGILWLGSRTTPSTGDDLGGGLLAFFAWSVWAVVSIISSLAAFFGKRALASGHRALDEIRESQA